MTRLIVLLALMMAILIPSAMASQSRSISDHARFTLPEVSYPSSYNFADSLKHIIADTLKHIGLKTACEALGRIFGMGTDSERSEQDTIKVAPKVSISESRKELNYDFRYSPIYETFFDTDGIDGWDHVESGRLDWNVTPRDTIGLARQSELTAIISRASVSSIDLMSRTTAS